MLDRDPETRIGSGKDDSFEIRQHPFFADMDWQKLVDLKLEAPYIPDINTKNETLAMQETDTMVQGDIKAQDAFEQMPESQIQYIRDN